MSTRNPKSDVLQGTLDLMVLRTLESMGPQHGFGLAKRIQQISAGVLDLNQGTLYPALLRLEQRGWIASQWGASDKNRRAKFRHCAEQIAGFGLFMVKAVLSGRGDEIVDLAKVNLFR